MTAALIILAALAVAVLVFGLAAFLADLMRDTDNDWEQK